MHAHDVMMNIYNTGLVITRTACDNHTRRHPRTSNNAETLWELFIFTSNSMSQLLEK